MQDNTNPRQMQSYDQVPRRSKNPLLTGHTRREHYLKICESGSVTEQSAFNISIATWSKRNNMQYVSVCQSQVNGTICSQIQAYTVPWLQNTTFHLTFINGKHTRKAKMTFYIIIKARIYAFPNICIIVCKLYFLIVVKNILFASV
jgi:hypothetical protein